MRVASLLPSLTEIACALGAQNELVARSHECDHPRGLEGLPILTHPKFEPEGTSSGIDDRVKELVSRGLSVYEVDAEALREAAPDVILTQDQCDVCAASLGDVERALESWLGTRPHIVSTAPGTLAEVWAQIPAVASALGREERGAELLASLTDRVTGIGERCGDASPKPRVACIEWLDPLMSAGNWMPELVSLAGGENLFGTAGEHSPWMAWEELRKADPDLLVVLPCGFDIARTRDEWGVLEALPGWSELGAVRTGRVFVADGNQYFNRSGPRLIDSLEILAGAFHPDRFPEFATHPGIERA